MEITTRISSTPAFDAEHHYECSKDHRLNLIRFTSVSPNNGFAQTEVLDCMFFEMEDAAAASVIDAFESSDDVSFASVDHDNVWGIATEIAERADRLVGDGHVAVHVRHNVEAS